MIKLIYYPKCSTCQKALKHLEKFKIEFEKRDIVKEKLNETELIKIYKISNLEINKFFNTSGIIYRQLNLKDKIKNITLEEKINLLASDGKLIKRPILIFNDKVILGYKEKEYEELINE